MVVTTIALNNMRDASVATINNNYTHIAVGTVNTAPAVSDTALGGEVLRKPFQETTGPTGGVLTTSMRISTTEANGNTLVEIGVFDESSGGTMASRNLITSLAKDNTKEVWIDIRYAFIAENS